MPMSRSGSARAGPGDRVEFEPLGIGLLRIDLALAGPGARPIAVDTRCDLPGDHCQLIATFALEGR